MRWNNNTSGFVLRRMSQIISDGSRTDKCFKDKDVNFVAKALREYSGEAVSPTIVKVFLLLMVSFVVGKMW